MRCSNGGKPTRNGSSNRTDEFLWKYGLALIAVWCIVALILFIGWIT